MRLSKSIAILLSFAAAAKASNCVAHDTVLINTPNTCACAEHFDFNRPVLDFSGLEMTQLEEQTSRYDVMLDVHVNTYHLLDLDGVRGYVFLTVENPITDVECTFNVVPGLNKLHIRTDNQTVSDDPTSNNCINFQALDPSGIAQAAANLNQANLHQFNFNIRLTTCSTPRGKAVMSCDGIQTSFNTDNNFLVGGDFDNCIDQTLNDRSVVRTMCDAQLTADFEHYNVSAGSMVTVTGAQQRSGRLRSEIVGSSATPSGRMVCQDSFQYSSSFDANDPLRNQVEAAFSLKGVVDTAENQVFLEDYVFTLEKAREEQIIDMVENTELSTDVGDLILRYDIQAGEDVVMDVCDPGLDTDGKSRRFRETIDYSTENFKNLLDSAASGDEGRGCLGVQYTLGNTESYACADDGDGNTQCNNYGKNPREIFLNRDTVFGVRVDEKQLPSDFSYTEWDIAITDFSYYHKVGAGADENDIDTDGTALNGAARVQVIDLSVFEDATQYVLEDCHTNVVCRGLYRANAADDAWSSDPWPQKVHDAAFFIHGRPFEDPQHCKQHFCAVRVTFQITNKTAGGYETPKSGRRLRISSKVKPATQEGVEISQTFTGVAYTPATNAPTASPTESPRRTAIMTVTLTEVRPRRCSGLARSPESSLSWLSWLTLCSEI